MTFPTIYRVFFEFKNVSVTFQSATDIILAFPRWQYAALYLDDIISFLKTPKEHLKHIDEVLLLLEITGMTTELKKCFCFSKTINFFEHIVSLGRLQVARRPQKIRVLQ